MSYAFVQDVAASWEQYERLAATVATQPDGLIVHVAGPTEEGFRIIEVWESEAAWERFETQRPRAAEAPGPPAPPPTFRTLRPRHVVYGRTAARTSQEQPARGANEAVGAS